MRLNTKGANRLHMGGGGFGRRPLFTSTAENPPCIGDARVSPKRTETKENKCQIVDVKMCKMELMSRRDNSMLAESTYARLATNVTLVK